MWKLWSLALGEKAHKRDQVADKVAVLRTVIFATYLIGLFKTILGFIFAAAAAYLLYKINIFDLFQ